MHLQISKWGNSLAVRIPIDYVRRIGIKEGDRVQAVMTLDGGFTIRATAWNRKRFAQELSQARAAMPMSDAVTNELRRSARY